MRVMISNLYSTMRVCIFCSMFVVLFLLASCKSDGVTDIASSECAEQTANELFNRVYEEVKKSDALPESEIAVIECAARFGNAKAQLFLGYGYLTGKFLKKDSKQAVDWLMEAAAAGSYEATMVLFSTHLLGVEESNLAKYYMVVREQSTLENYAAKYVIATSYCLGFYEYEEDGSKCELMLQALGRSVSDSNRKRLARAMKTSEIELSIKSYLFAKYMNESKEYVMPYTEREQFTVATALSWQLGIGTGRRLASRSGCNGVACNLNNARFVGDILQINSGALSRLSATTR